MRIRSTSTATATSISSCCGRDGDVVLRGLGDCRFEPATERARTRSAADGLDDRVQRDVGGLELAADARLRPVPRAEDTSELRRQLAGAPGPSGDRYAAPIALGARLLHAVHLVQRLEPLGQRDLRMSNDRHYYRDGEDQLWRIAPGEPPTAVHRGRRLASAADLGHGHRQPGRHRRRPARGVPHEPGRQQAADARGRARSGPTYRDIALELGVTAQRPYTGDDVLPSTAWHPEFEDVNNDGHGRPVRDQGKRRGAGRPGEPRPEQPVHRPGATARSTRRARRRASSSFERARGAALVDLNLDGLLDLVVVNRRATVDALAQRRHAATRRSPRRWAIGSTSGCEQPAPNVDAIGAWVEVRVGERTTAREVTVGGGHAGGKLGWLHVGLGSARARPRSACSGPTAPSDRG